MRTTIKVLVTFTLFAFSLVHSAEDIETVAIIGTGDMGNTLGPKIADLGYSVVYGSRDPSSEKVQALLKKTGPNASAATQKNAAEVADIVILTVPWPAMEQVAQNLGNLDGKIVADISLPFRQGPDGYPELTVETSSAEMIQAWNPGANVVKWGMPTAHYIEEPLELGIRPYNNIASDDRHSKEVIAKIAYGIGQDPVDGGPLRMSRAIESQVILFMIPIYQRRTAHHETVMVRTSYWSCFWGDDWSDPVFDANNLAEFPDYSQPLKDCSEYPADR